MNDKKTDLTMSIIVLVLMIMTAGQGIYKQNYYTLLGGVVATILSSIEVYVLYYETKGYKVVPVVTSFITMCIIVVLLFMSI